jgi:hypothetical protein
LSSPPPPQQQQQQQDRALLEWQWSYDNSCSQLIRLCCKKTPQLQQAW